jgi:hypothetical protein
MNLTRQLLAVLVFGACAAAFAQADARPRSGKHPANAAGHVGQHHRVGLAKPLRSAVPAAPTRNAIGAATQSAGVGVGASPPLLRGAPAAGTVKPNAINAHIGMGVVSPSLPGGVGKIGSTTNPVNAVRAAPSAPPAHAGGINGTGMGRPGNTLGTIGGPAKLATGITGTGMKQKR